MLEVMILEVKVLLDGKIGKDLLQVLGVFWLAICFLLGNIA